MRASTARSAVPAVLILLAMTACQPMTAGAGTPVHCSVIVDRPGPDNPAHPGHVVSDVRYWCENPGADRLSLTVHLQRQTSHGGWVDVAATSFTARRGETVRTAETRYRTRTVSIRCAGGTYRTTVVGAASGASTFAAHYDLIGSSVTDPCTLRPPF